ncbi:hypothetical protein DESA109040_14840 [Deinococcus saxicola]
MNSRKIEKQNVVEMTPPLELRHDSTDMPAELYAQLQIYVARQKAVRGKGQPSVSIQNVITEAVRVHLAQHDR